MTQAPEQPECKDFETLVLNIFDLLSTKCYQAAAAKGFWNHANRLAHIINYSIPSGETQTELSQALQQMLLGQRLALIHSELSEGLEGARKHLNDEHLPQFTSLEVELADALIRIFDLSGRNRLRLGAALIAKLAYNASRPHMHGKLS